MMGPLGWDWEASTGFLISAKQACAAVVSLTEPRRNAELARGNAEDPKNLSKNFGIGL
jgi:hypothetical protein